MRKLTIEEVREFFKSKGYELLSNEYISSSSRMIARDNDGFMYLSSYSALNSGTTPRKADATNPYSIDNIKLWLKLNNKSIELNSKDYKNKSEKLEWKCLICGDNFSASWDFIQKHKDKDPFIRHSIYPELPCFRSNERLTIEQVRDFVNDLGYDLLSNEYINNHSDLIIKDEHGYLYTTAYHELKQGNIPEMVNKFNPYTIENIKLYLKLNNPKYELVSDIYLGSDSELILKDNNGYLYNAKWCLLQSGRFPRFVSTVNRFSIDNIKLWVKTNNKPFELISEEYVGTKNLLSWKCLKNNCGEVFQSSWGDISQGHGCGYCYGTKVGLSNCLATNNPDVALEWHPTLNGDLTPYDVAHYSNSYAWWKCSKCNHEWKTLISNRTFLNNICPICALKNKSGEGHHNWKGGITPINKQIRQSISYKIWRKQVFERDNYTCQCCKDKKGHNLHAHHIENFSDNESLRFDVNNGITLCEECHDPTQVGSFHNIYGTHNNTKEQLDEYIKIIQNKR